jgi:hypothetical protein
MLGLDHNQVDVLLDNVAEYCFKKGMSIEKFINNVTEVTRLSLNIEAPIDELQNLIMDKQKELNKLREIICNGILNDQITA